MTAADQRWADALAAARLLQTLPFALGGAHVRARPGPQRDAWLAALRTGLGGATPVCRAPAGAGADALLGGLDLAATLASGRPAFGEGLLKAADGGVLLLPMAERLAPDGAAVLAAVLDQGRLPAGPAGGHPVRLLVIALDEGADDERLSPLLSARLALLLDLEGVRPGPAGVAATSAAVSAEAAAGALCRASAALGLDSPRWPLHALRCARALAAADARPLNEGDLALAVRLVLAPRAICAPAAAGPAEPAPPPSPEPAGGAPRPESDGPGAGSLAELLVESARAVLPPGLEPEAAAPTRGAAGGAGRSRGALQRAGGRGRPAGTQARPPRAGERLALVETLKAAAPWQAVRRREQPPAPGAQDRFRVLRGDLRTQRRRRPAEMTSIFLVDASGSAAVARLAEAKGAVELLLTRAYARRDEVALVAFRGTRAEVLLPPTRSLARARRALADLPGGGGTPIAHALETAHLLGLGCRARGRSPTIILLTDGRANVARTAGVDPMDDAEAAARAIAAAGLRAILIDVAPRPRAEGPRLARALGARHVALPRVEAGRVVAAVEAGA